MLSCRDSFVNVSDSEREYAALFMSAGLCQMTQEYIAQHDQPNLAELTKISSKITSGSIYRI